MKIKQKTKKLSLFDDLKTIFNVNKNENESENESVNDNVNDNVNENESESENENENGNESDDGQYYLEQINNNFKEINETESFKDQIDILKKIPDLSDYWHMHYYEGNKS